MMSHVGFPREGRTPARPWSNHRGRSKLLLSSSPEERAPGSTSHSLHPAARRGVCDCQPEQGSQGLWGGERGPLPGERVRVAQCAWRVGPSNSCSLTEAIL